MAGEKIHEKAHDVHAALLRGGKAGLVIEARHLRMLARSAGIAPNDMAVFLDYGEVMRLWVIADVSPKSSLARVLSGDVAGDQRKVLDASSA